MTACMHTSLAYLEAIHAAGRLADVVRRGFENIHGPSPVIVEQRAVVEDPAKDKGTL